MKNIQLSICSLDNYDHIQYDYFSTADYTWAAHTHIDKGHTCTTHTHTLMLATQAQYTHTHGPHTPTGCMHINTYTHSPCGPHPTVHHNSVGELGPTAVHCQNHCVRQSLDDSTKWWIAGDVGTTSGSLFQQTWLLKLCLQNKHGYFLMTSPPLKWSESGR